MVYAGEHSCGFTASTHPRSLKQYKIITMCDPNKKLVVKELIINTMSSNYLQNKTYRTKSWGCTHDAIYYQTLCKQTS